jgi:hypothetical protein
VNANPQTIESRTTKDRAETSAAANKKVKKLDHRN